MGSALGSISLLDAAGTKLIASRNAPEGTQYYGPLQPTLDSNTDGWTDICIVRSNGKQAWIDCLGGNTLERIWTAKLPATIRAESQLGGATGLFGGQPSIAIAFDKTDGHENGAVVIVSLQAETVAEVVRPRGGRVVGAVCLSPAYGGSLLFTCQSVDGREVRRCTRVDQELMTTVVARAGADDRDFGRELVSWRTLDGERNLGVGLRRRRPGRSVGWGCLVLAEEDEGVNTMFWPAVGVDAASAVVGLPGLHKSEAGGVVVFDEHYSCSAGAAFGGGVVLSADNFRPVCLEESLGESWESNTGRVVSAAPVPARSGCKSLVVLSGLHGALERVSIFRVGIDETRVLETWPLRSCPAHAKLR
jgi:hypothetical protein